MMFGSYQLDEHRTCPRARLHKRTEESRSAERNARRSRDRRAVSCISRRVNNGLLITVDYGESRLATRIAYAVDGSNRRMRCAAAGLLLAEGHCFAADGVAKSIEQRDGDRRRARIDGDRGRVGNDRRDTRRDRGSSDVERAARGARETGARGGKRIAGTGL